MTQEKKYEPLQRAIRSMMASIESLQAKCQTLQTENERLRMELVAEARAAADQKLRADQLAKQHRMQAKMHAQATKQAAELDSLNMQLCEQAEVAANAYRELEARKMKPLSDEAVVQLYMPWDFGLMDDEAYAIIRAVEHAHGINDSADAG